MTETTATDRQMGYLSSLINEATHRLGLHDFREAAGHVAGIDADQIMTSDWVAKKFAASAIRMQLINDLREGVISKDAAQSQMPTVYATWRASVVEALGADLASGLTSRQASSYIDLLK